MEEYLDGFFPLLILLVPIEFTTTIEYLDNVEDGFFPGFNCSSHLLLESPENCLDGKRPKLEHRGATSVFISKPWSK